MAVKVRKRKDKWWVVIDHKNKRKSKCIGPSKRAADQVAEKIRAKLALGQFSLAEEDAEQAVTFAAFYDRWLNTYVAGSAKPSTLERYAWPGNVRELENIIERAVILADEATLQLDDTLETDTALPTARTGTLEDVERTHILQILEETNWRIRGKRGAAEILDINPSTLRSRMQKLGIERPDYAS